MQARRATSGRGNRARSPAAVLGAGLIACAVAWSTDPARAQLTPNEVELEDVIEIEVLGRDVIAFDLTGTGSPSVRLDIGESVSFVRASGRIGLAMTDARALAVSPGTDGWREVRYGIHEVRPEGGFVGKRVALVVTSRRILGYDSRSGVWMAQGLGPNEETLHAAVGDGTAVVVTNRTAYGLSPSAGGFFSRSMTIHERIQDVRVGANMATLSTSQRLLVFRAPTGIWTEERRPLH